MTNNEVMYNVLLKDWVLGTIRGVEAGEDWNASWRRTYRAIGGKSDSIGQKVCPRKGAQTLYELGRIKNTQLPLRKPGLREIWDNYGKNGAYSILALELQEKNPNIESGELWKQIKSRIRSDLGEEPAKSNQGAPTIASKLWRMDMIVD